MNQPQNGKSQQPVLSRFIHKFKRESSMLQLKNLEGELEA